LKLAPTSIPDVLMVTPTVFGDDRGYFMEVWHQAKYAAAGLDVRFVQDNQSRSRIGTLRGLHYQVEQTQGKLVRALSGEIFDVAVDLRRSSPTFGKWVGATLSGENKTQLYVPPGFAHGFLVTSETAEVEYKCTDYYAPQHERSIVWNDPDIGIEWPLPPGITPILSAKDMAGKPLRQAEVFA
jgi:dTDP-4-dehydrorhamnose 3,5-epimerase